eukprot:91712-Rhodomonas_salina.1
MGVCYEMGCTRARWSPMPSWQLRRLFCTSLQPVDPASHRSMRHAPAQKEWEEREGRDGRRGSWAGRGRGRGRGGKR